MNNAGRNILIVFGTVCAVSIILALDWSGVLAPNAIVLFSGWVGTIFGAVYGVLGAIIGGLFGFIGFVLWWWLCLFVAGAACACGLAAVSAFLNHRERMARIVHGRDADFRSEKLLRSIVYAPDLNIRAEATMAARNYLDTKTHP